MNRQSEASEVKTTIDAKWLAEQVNSAIYNQGTAKIMNIFEATLPDTREWPMGAIKHLVQDALALIGRQTGKCIIDVLGDWNETATFGGFLTPEEQLAAEREDAETPKVANKPNGLAAILILLDRYSRN